MADKYLEFVKKENPDNKSKWWIFEIYLKEIKNIIIDESFIHFAFEDDGYTLISATELFKEFSNVIVIKRFWDSWYQSRLWCDG